MKKLIIFSVLLITGLSFGQKHEYQPMYMHNAVEASETDSIQVYVRTNPQSTDGQTKDLMKWVPANRFSLSYGNANQIPFVNSGENGFVYDPKFYLVNGLYYMDQNTSVGSVMNQDGFSVSGIGGGSSVGWESIGIYENSGENSSTLTNSGLFLTNQTAGTMKLSTAGLDFTTPDFSSTHEFIVDNESWATNQKIKGTQVFVKTEDEDFIQKKDLDDAIAGIPTPPTPTIQEVYNASPSLAGVTGRDSYAFTTNNVGGLSSAMNITSSQVMIRSNYLNLGTFAGSSSENRISIYNGSSLSLGITVRDGRANPSGMSYIMDYTPTYYTRTTIPSWGNVTDYVGNYNINAKIIAYLQSLPSYNASTPQVLGHDASGNIEWQTP